MKRPALRLAMIVAVLAAVVATAGVGANGVLGAGGPSGEAADAADVALQGRGAGAQAAVGLPRAQPGAAGVAAARLDEATALLRSYVADGKIAGAVAGVARNGRTVYLESAGVQSLETRTPMSERSLFRIYSMTKSVTAVAAMMLRDEGKFALTDPVSKFIPEFRNVQVVAADGSRRAPAREMTVQDLLLHTSGLNHRTSEIYRREQVRAREMTMAQFIGNLVRVGLMEDPGTRYRYSEGTTVVGRLVEIWSGQPLEVFFEQRIFKPLRMADTGFWAREDQRGLLTTVYGPSPEGLRPIELETVPFTERPALLEGAVGLLSTVPDYMRLAQMLLNGGELDGVRLLPAATVAEMTRNGLSPEVQQVRGGSMGWGLANVNVLLNDTPARGANAPATRGEYGWDGTAGTIFWVDPTARTVIVLMTQSSPANPDSIRQRFKSLIQQAIE
jgi:CubicO group peptidase (beta-lactamase class C family)